MYKHILLSILFSTLLALLSGCGSSNRHNSSENDIVTTGKSSSLQLAGKIIPADQNQTDNSSTVSGITINSIIRLQQGETIPLSLTITYDNGITEQLISGVIFFSDNPQIASVDTNGTITAHNPGNTLIHAVYEGKDANIAVQVLPASTPVPTDLNISFVNTQLEAGSSMHLFATVTLSNGTTTSPEGVKWQSKTTKICTVSEAGLVKALQPGTCQISATYNTLHATSTIEIIPLQEKKSYECPATQQSENTFSDTFITDKYRDIDYDQSLIFADLKVDEIEALFNHARSADPTVNQPMVLPPQQIWDSYNASEKILYLTNAERCARGIRPLEGVDPVLLEDVTKPYAEFISTHEDTYLTHPHTADGKDPRERMEESGIVLGKNSEYYGENIAMIGIYTVKAQPLYEAEAKALYAWMYQDRNESYGHRMFILHTNYHENAGNPEKEGLIAAHTAEITYKGDNGFYLTKTFTVMDGFDPTATWDNNLSSVMSVPLYKNVSD